MEIKGEEAAAPSLRHDARTATARPPGGGVRPRVIASRRWLVVVALSFWINRHRNEWTHAKRRSSRLASRSLCLSPWPRESRAMDPPSPLSGCEFRQRIEKGRLIELRRFMCRSWPRHDLLAHGTINGVPWVVDSAIDFRAWRASRKAGALLFCLCRVPFVSGADLRKLRHPAHLADWIVNGIFAAWAIPYWQADAKERISRKCGLQLTPLTGMTSSWATGS